MIKRMLKHSLSKVYSLCHRGEAYGLGNSRFGTVYLRNYIVMSSNSVDSPIEAG